MAGVKVWCVAGLSDYWASRLVFPAVQRDFQYVPVTPLNLL